MIRLKPTIEMLPANCPKCLSALAAKDFYIPGMRNLADLHCADCDREFYGDLPAGQALFTPILLEKETGTVFDNDEAAWFSEWLAESYKNRSDEKISLETKVFSEVKEKVILLNCLDVLYGHSLLKLLNAQFYLDHKRDFSLIIIAPRFLEWMLPDGIAEAWVIDLPLRRGAEWNDWLAREFAEKIENFKEVFLSVAFSHPHHEDFDIERFTRVAPFPLEDFREVKNEPIITFIWREDRLWETENDKWTTRYERIKDAFAISKNPVAGQMRKIADFAEILKSEYPKLDFAVIGLGKSENFPAWIKDLRLTKLNAETEREWCERYAKSHAVIGVHGSNMLLPSAHAGGVIELLDENRQGNFLQDILFRGADAREMMFRYRFAPHSTAPGVLAQMASMMLRFADFQKLMSPEFCRHQERYDYEKLLTKKREK